MQGCRGESFYILEFENFWLIAVIEGLGTRGKVADAMYQAYGGDPYHAMGWSAFATIANDFATSGANPAASLMYLGAGSNEWFRNADKVKAFGRGWADGCRDVHCTLGGGEMPMLRDVIMPETFEILGAAFGIMPKPQRPIMSGGVQAEDSIVVIASSGVHDNGYTLCRDLVSFGLLPNGYSTCVEPGLSYGQALLKPTTLYGPLVKACAAKGVEVHSWVNITGHGWAKLARADQPLHYMVHTLPPVPPIFRFIQERGSVSLENMYHTFNMGGGFAAFAPPRWVGEIRAAAKALGFESWDVGSVFIADDGMKKVVLPNGVQFTDKDAAIR